MLTVWRRLPIEVDSMGEALQNFVLGNFTSGRILRRTEQATINVNTSNPLEVNRFENGRVTFNGNSLRVVSNGANAITVENTSPGIVSVPSGAQFQLFDDDDFNDNDGTNLDGDTGEDIPEPDTALLTANSDDPNANVFATAYVRPVYDVIDPNDNNIFQANTDGSAAGDIRPLFVDRDLRNTDIDVEFWTVYLLGSYQHTLIGDNDPSTESATFGIVDEITNVTGEGSGALIFLELHNQKEIVDYPAPINLRSLAVTVGHEVGHLFSGEHGEDGIMGEFQPDGRLLLTSNQFSPTTINKIRELLHP